MPVEKSTGHDFMTKGLCHFIMCARILCCHIIHTFSSNVIEFTFSFPCLCLFCFDQCWFYFLEIVCLDLPYLHWEVGDSYVFPPCGWDLYIFSLVLLENISYQIDEYVVRDGVTSGA